MSRQAAATSIPPTKQPKKSLHRGWDAEKVAVIKAAFIEFLMRIKLNSKEGGSIILGEHLYMAQHMVIDAIFDGLGRDIHDFKILKSRQLGISTLCRALTLFWIGINPGLKGAMVFDTAAHQEEARTELMEILDNLPKNFDFPRKERENRYFATLNNDSRINFAAAGVKNSASGKTLGAGSGLAFSHRSELCGYGDGAGMETYRHALARTNPNRLFIDESTARGPNLWMKIWEDARDDPHCVCIFIGWWAHPAQKIDRDEDDFARYGLIPPTEKESQRMKLVLERYGVEITPEQLAWIRREMDPQATADGDAEPDYEGPGIRIQEQPWLEEEAFQFSGSVFFPDETLTDMLKKHVSAKYKTYAFATGLTFMDCRVYPAHNPASVQLRVWEEPLEEAAYVVAIDPAFGHSEDSDRSAIQVLRCYSDGVDQVAEYAWPLIDTQQLAWVVMALESWYAGEKSQVYRILEMNGPGEAVFNELRALRIQLQHQYFGSDARQPGLARIQSNVKNYIYTRSDSMGMGHSYHWQTTERLKVTIMERLRDMTNAGIVHIRSRDTLEEMKSITREGDQIKAQGSKKDDRVMALAMSIRCWEERVRRHLIAQKRSRTDDEMRRRLTVRDQVQMFQSNMLENFFKGHQLQRHSAKLAALRERYRRR